MVLKSKVEYIFTIDEDFIIPDDDDYNQYYIVKIKTNNITRRVTYLRDRSSWDWNRSSEPFSSYSYGFQHYSSFFRYNEGSTIIPYSHLFTDYNYNSVYGPYGVISYWSSYTSYSSSESRPSMINRKIKFLKNNNNLKLNKEININLPSSSSINFIDNYGYILKSSTLLSDSFDLSNTIPLTDSIENIYINNSNINLYSILIFNLYMIYI